MHRSRLLATGVLACAGAVAAAVPAGAATTPGCVVANNVVFVVDDSGSMFVTDPGDPTASPPTFPLRTQAIQLEVKRSSSDGKTFAAIEFGDTADVLFPPELVKPNRNAMLSSLTQINADNGSTDYNLAFDTANSTDPNAQARIFMTDGGHNAGDYNNTHLGGGKPKTYVIGFGDSAAAPEDAARLQQIATDTGGQYFAQTSSAKLVSVMNSIDNLINCQSATSTVTINDTFTKVNQAKTHQVTVPKGNKAEDLVTSFNQGANFAISGIVETLHGKVIAKSNLTVTAARARKPKVKKLKVTKQTGGTFINLHISGLKPGGKLKFKLTAKQLATSIDPNNPGGSVTTQLTPHTS